MRILLVAMMLAFTVAGLLIGGTGLRELIRKLMARHRFEQAEGEVMEVKRKVMRSTNRRPFKPTILNLPVIRFTSRTGETVTFTSETGDAGNVSRYSVGNHLPVRYDPLKEFAPMIDDRWGIWIPNVMMLIAGVGFLAGVALIWFAFGERIIAP